MAKTKKRSTRIIPGLGAARSSHLLKVLRDQRVEAARRFRDIAEDARRMDAAFGCPANFWTTLPLVQTARKSWLHAYAADTFKPLRAA